MADNAAAVFELQQPHENDSRALAAPNQGVAIREPRRFQRRGSTLLPAFESTPAASFSCGVRCRGCAR